MTQCPATEGAVHWPRTGLGGRRARAGEYLKGRVCGPGGRWNCAPRRPNERLRSGSGLRVGTWAQTYSLRLCTSVPCLTRDAPQCPQQNVRNGSLEAADQITASRPAPTSTHTQPQTPSGRSSAAAMRQRSYESHSLKIITSCFIQR